MRIDGRREREKEQERWRDENDEEQNVDTELYRGIFDLIRREPGNRRHEREEEEK